MPKLNKPVFTGFANVDRILNSNLINRTTLAKLMYPNNSCAGTYLYNKLNGVQRQTFGPHDRDKLLTALRTILKEHLI